ncbi:hypothetical protein [Nitratireductor sp. ZSWI3]|uniref:hypothetical protein n=1 Tax=Nitratireductor sp. ZSWI3 TaxID=2966359 RepID=UPI00214FC67D|nr:hypothetical protein [Nitratireductor sp. ZSWI3]MCR4265948.1 hypothetical protein [Nitratireductor sp. ZSWI3]
MDAYLLVATLTLHVLAGVFWAGSTSAMANLASTDAARLFPFQMGSAALTVLTGLALWWFQLGTNFDTHEQILAVGLVAALIAAAAQIALVGRARSRLAGSAPADDSATNTNMTQGNRIAAGLLMITVASMVIARFF